VDAFAGENSRYLRGYTGELHKLIAGFVLRYVQVFAQQTTKNPKHLFRREGTQRERNESAH